MTCAKCGKETLNGQTLCSECTNTAYNGSNAATQSSPFVGSVPLQPAQPPSGYTQNPTPLQAGYAPNNTLAAKPPQSGILVTVIFSVLAFLLCIDTIWKLISLSFTGGNFLFPTFVGGANFASLLSDNFFNAVGNSVLFSVCALVLAAGIGAICAAIASTLPAIGRKIFTVFALIPLFVPTIFLNYFLDVRIKSDDFLAKAVLIIVFTISIAPFAYLVFLGAFRKKYPAGIAVLAYFIGGILFLFSFGFDEWMIFTRMDSITSTTTLISFVISQGFMQMKLGIASAAELLVALPIALIACITIPALFNKMEKRSSFVKKSFSLKGIIIFSITIVLIDFFLFIFDIATKGTFSGMPLSMYFALIVANAALFALLAAGFIAPLVLGSPKVKALYIGLLSFLYVFSGIAAKYIVIQELGLINNILLYILNNSFCIPLIIAAGFVAGSMYKNQPLQTGQNKYFSAVGVPLFAATIIQFCMQWSAIETGYIYISEVRYLSLPMQIYHFISSFGAQISQVIPLVVVAILVPLVLLLAAVFAVKQNAKQPVGNNL